jgi:hypothetical protein
MSCKTFARSTYASHIAYLHHDIISFEGFSLTIQSQYHDSCTNPCSQNRFCSFRPIFPLSLLTITRQVNRDLREP